MKPEVRHILGGMLCCLVAQSCLTVCDLVDCSPPGTSVHGDSSGKNTGVGCHTLLQGIITLPTKVRLVKVMVFPLVVYGCESWTVKKAEC